MSSFGARRKAKVIKVTDEVDPTEDAATGSTGDSSNDDPTKPVFNSKPGRNPFRQSGLRKSFNPANADSLKGDDATKTNDEEEDDGPVVVRPAVSRGGSLKQKKRPVKSSRLSFGGDAEDAEDEDSNEGLTPKKMPLNQRAVENSAIKKTLESRGLPVRPFGDDDDRPKYSKEYLEELQSSTPNTPQNITSLPPDEADVMELDASELEGAMIVDTPEPQQLTTTILTDAEIREKKERRARLAKEENFLSVEDDEDSFGRKKRDDSRLIAEDEDLGEGFDNYVEDGGLSLGKRAEKERRRNERQKMAELITAAEGHSSDGSSDSDAERRIAYETAQTRAGMEGLKKPKKDPTDELLQVPPKITPLPSLSECLTRLKITLKGMEQDIKRKQQRVDQLKNDKTEIIKREGEVQALLDEMGRKYQEAMNKGKVSGGSTPGAISNSDLAGERGLESLGTPLRKEDEDEEMTQES